ncbi:keratin, type I cytoskeletal 9-like isoform X2 [Crotalus tigris]|uniref:keratin, type I cytoskeletal 9-like isoform X2 n=1 Tax=Crotalus tigris TaxID=88082 RepID=UPI00192F44FD|nr:keratin, type I cytoskeletal 9-like isoform X2 [Crotalus tigris]XP_039199084.1 keratin, type I cytoskeletal 9-like isoform X2 [Crotalus tigris]
MCRSFGHQPVPTAQLAGGAFSAGPCSSYGGRQGGKVMHRLFGRQSVPTAQLAGGAFGTSPCSSYGGRRGGKVMRCLLGRQPVSAGQLAGGALGAGSCGSYSGWQGDYFPCKSWNHSEESDCIGQKRISVAGAFRKDLCCKPELHSQLQNEVAPSAPEGWADGTVGAGDL